METTIMGHTRIIGTILGLCWDNGKAMEKHRGYTGVL